MHVVYDASFIIDKPKWHNLILVEGALFFAHRLQGPESPSNQYVESRAFHANIIFVNGGLLQAGTEATPVEYNLSIQLHGKKYGPTIPTFGNKCIVNNGGTLDLHGFEFPTRFTSNVFLFNRPFTTGVTLFAVGDDLSYWTQRKFATLSYSYSQDASEVQSISTVSYNPFVFGGLSFVSLGTPQSVLPYPSQKYTFAGTTPSDTFNVEYKPELIFLDRTLKVEGYVGDSSSSEYGAHVTTHCVTGDECAVTRITNVAFQRVGKASLKAAHPLFFDRVGNAQKSYLKGNLVWESYNRGIVLASTDNLRVEGNTLFDIKGHGIALQDGVETQNIFHDNYVSKVKKAYSFMTTDTMPAAFYITNPDNSFTNNFAHSSEKFGFWYHLADKVNGATEGDNVCPAGTPLGTFKDNKSVSNRFYGLRIFNKYSPRSQPCTATSFTHGTDALTSPYGESEPVCAVFENFECYRTGRSCAISEAKGCVQFKNFHSIDSAKAHMEISESGEAAWDANSFLENNSKVEGGVFVGHPTDALVGDVLDEVADFQNYDPIEAKGVTTSRDEYFSVEGPSFYNFDQSDLQSAIFTCSQCDEGEDRDSARTTYIKGVAFDDATVTKRLRFNSPYRDIVIDVDGSLTNKAPLSTIIREGKHLDDDCTATAEEVAKFDGVICDPSIQVRRVSWYHPQPWGNLRGQRINLLRWDQDLVQSHVNAGTLEEYRNNIANYQQFSFDWWASPSRGWHLPIPTGHRYLAYFGAYGLDFTSLTVETSPLWNSDDHVIEVFQNHTDIRAAIIVNAVDQDGNELLRNNPSYNENDDKNSWEMGSHLHSSDDHEFYYVVDGRDTTVRKTKFKAIRCEGPCDDAVIEGTIIEQTIRRWSDLQMWATAPEFPNGRPIDGDDVDIPAHWNLLYDLDPVADTERFGTITIYGRLSFDE